MLGSGVPFLQIFTVDYVLCEPCTISSLALCEDHRALILTHTIGSFLSLLGTVVPTYIIHVYTHCHCTVLHSHTNMHTVTQSTCTLIQ